MNFWGQPPLILNQGWYMDDLLLRSCIQWCDLVGSKKLTFGLHDFFLENWLYMYIIIFYEHTLKPKWCMHLFMYMYRYDALIIALLVSFKCNDCIGSCYCFLVIALTDSYSIWVLDSSDHLCQLCGFSSFPALPLPRFQWSQCSSGMYGLFT